MKLTIINRDIYNYFLILYKKRIYNTETIYDVIHDNCMWTLSGDSISDDIRPLD